MIKSNLSENNYYLPNKLSLSSEKAKLYFTRRKYLKKLIKTIHKKISVNSQSYFLSLFLMDIIFLKDNLEKVFYDHFPAKASFFQPNEIELNDYILLSLVCLIISYKFSGSSSILFSMNNLVKIIHYISEGNFCFTPRDLVIGEACVIKILKYKLNFYTVYHYLLFFFTHGIIFKKILKKNRGLGGDPEKKILEKIYIQAREMIDFIIDKEEYFELYNGKYNYILVCQILKWASEKVLNIKIKDDEDVFKVIYNINITDEQKKKFLEIIEKKSKKQVTKKNIEKKNDILKRESSYNLPFGYKEKKKLSYNNLLKIDMNNNLDYNIDNNLYRHNYAPSVINIKQQNKNNNGIKNSIQRYSTGIGANTNKKINLTVNNKKSVTITKLDVLNNLKNEKVPLDSQKNKKQKKIKNFLLKKDVNNMNQKSFYISNIINNEMNFNNKKHTNDFALNFEENELKSEERIQKPRVINNYIELKKNYINDNFISPSNKKNKIIHYPNYNHENQFFNHENDNETLDQEPKDSKRKNKIKEMKNNVIINKNFNDYKNQQNTIIINNNLNINTFINNNTNYNKNDNVVSEFLRLTSLNEKYRINPPVINITLSNN